MLLYIMCSSRWSFKNNNTTYKVLVILPIYIEFVDERSTTLETRHFILVVAVYVYMRSRSET